VPAGSEEALEAIQADVYAAAIALGGTVTAEHGIGTTRRDWLIRQRGVEAVDVMRRIKAALDPAGILNPGKVV
jgi:FAD/FMN-containing dehydrogenase